MKIQELHKAVLTAICQGISDSVHMAEFVEDNQHIDATFNFEGASSYARLEDFSAILCRYGFIIGKIYFGEPTEIHVVSWIPDCRFKTAIAEACSIFDLTEDDQTIKDLENVETIGRIIACAMKYKIL